MSWAAPEKVESRVRHFGGDSPVPVQNAALVLVYWSYSFMLSTSACALCLGALFPEPKNAVKIIRIGLSGTKKSPAAREMKEALRALPSSIPRMWHLSASLIRILFGSFTPPTARLQLHRMKAIIERQVHELGRASKGRISCTSFWHGLCFSTTKCSCLSVSVYDL